MNLNVALSEVWTQIGIYVSGNVSAIKLFFIWNVFVKIGCISAQKPVLQTLIPWSWLFKNHCQAMLYRKVGSEAVKKK